MLQTPYIRENKEEVIQKLLKKNYDAKDIIELICQKDDLRKETQSQLDDVLAQSNQLSKEIGLLFKNGQADKAQEAKKQTANLKEKSKSLGTTLQQLQHDLQDLLTQIPNVPHESVPSGNSADDNEVTQEKGTIPNLGDTAMPHWELAKKYDLIDFELGNKITGAGFPVYKGQGAKLQRALINYFLDKNTSAGYQEVQVPHMVIHSLSLTCSNVTLPAI